MNADPHPSVCYNGSPNDLSVTVGARLTSSWPRALDSASSTQKCDFGNINKPAAATANPFYHSSNTEKQELLDLKLQIVKQKAKFDKLSSRLSKCEFDNKVLKAEKITEAVEASYNINIKNMEPMQMLIKTNRKLVADNARLTATLQDYITSSVKDKQVIKTLQEENQLLRQQQQNLPKESSTSSALETITAPGIHKYLDSMEEDCSTLPTLDSSHSCRNREYINMLINDISSNDWLIITNKGKDNNNMETSTTTSTTINSNWSSYLPRSNRRNSDPVENISFSNNKVLPPPCDDAPTHASSKARESRFDIRRLCSSLTDRSIIPHHRIVSSSKQSDDLLVDFCKGPRSQQDTALSLRWSFKS